GHAAEITVYGYTDPAGAKLTTRDGAPAPQRATFDDLSGAYRAQVAGSGVTAEVEGAAPPSADGASPSAVRLKVTAAPDAVPGLRELHLAAPNGVSNAFW